MRLLSKLFGKYDKSQSILDFKVSDSAKQSSPPPLNKPQSNVPSQQTTDSFPDAIALLRKGEKYHFGKDGVVQDYRKALDCYLQAAKMGNADAAYYVGCMHDHAIGIVQNYGEAYKWYRRAADQGHEIAQFSVGVFLRDGMGVHKDYFEAARWIRLSAQQGYADAQFNMGVMYLRGDGVSQDLGNAVNWLEMAARQGKAEAQRALYQLAQKSMYDWNKLKSFPFRAL
jgi:TPR repeat protein